LDAEEIIEEETKTRQATQRSTFTAKSKTDRLKPFSAALRAIFCSMLHKYDIGEEVFDDALKIMIYGVVIQLYEGDAL
jgi:hypothetical protein